MQCETTDELHDLLTKEGTSYSLKKTWEIVLYIQWILKKKNQLVSTNPKIASCHKTPNTISGSSRQYTSALQLAALLAATASTQEDKL